MIRPASLRPTTVKPARAKAGSAKTVPHKGATTRASVPRWRFWDRKEAEPAPAKKPSRQGKPQKPSRTQKPTKPQKAQGAKEPKKAQAAGKTPFTAKPFSRLPFSRTSSARKPSSHKPSSRTAAPRKRSAKAAPPAAHWWSRRADAPEGAARGTARSRPAKSAEAAREQRPLLQRPSPGASLVRGLVLAVALVGMVGFAVALAKVTLVPSPASDALVHTNLRPGASIRAYVDQPEVRDGVKQIGGNVLLGVPFGVLLPALFPRTRGLLRVGLLTALVMVLVEAAQGAIVEGRAFDIDDVILNTAGSLLGYLLLGRRLGRALHPRRRRWWHAYGFGTPPDEPNP